MPIDTTVNNLVINKLTKQQYESIQNPSDTELYLVPDEIDAVPTSGSENPVESGGVYDALQEKVDVDQGVANAGKSLVVGNDGMVSPDTAPLSKLTASIPFGQVDATSTSTDFTATVDGITELRDGICCYLMNGVVTSASGWTLNINDLGAKPVYSTMAAASRTTTIFDINYTMLFVYNEDRVSGGCWDIFYGYYSDDDVTGYNVRQYYHGKKPKTILYRYQMLFTCTDGLLLPVNTVSNSVATNKELTTESFDVFGEVYYYGTKTTIQPNAGIDSGMLWSQASYTLCDLRYSFNTGSTLVAGNDVYVVCVPQSNGSVKLASTPLAFSLPSTEDGLLYKRIGKCYDTYRIILEQHKPVYYYKDGAIREWTNSPDTDIMVPITYSNLVTLKTGGNLVPGMQYRIIDYTCTTTQANTSAANHPFDIIVTAVSETELNENARAAHHSGDQYFANCDLDSWEIKYCLENDPDRFAWADDQNGKGVIYYMKDEWANIAPFDFKNILFTRSYEWFGDHQNWSDSVLGYDPQEDMDFYFLSWVDEHDDVLDASVLVQFLTNDEDSYSGIYGNEIKETGAYAFGMSDLDSSKLALPNTIIVNSYYYESGIFYGCYNNKFGNNCHYNTLGNCCYVNSFGNDCYSNTFGNDCYSNTFENNVSGNSFRNSCRQNSFGNDCYSNTFGNNCYSNTFGNNVSGNSFGNNINSNSFGNECYDNTFGNNVNDSSFGNNINSNSFGNYCKAITVFDSVLYCNVPGGSSSSTTIQNAHILNGTKGTSSANKLTITFTENKNYTQVAGLVKTNDAGTTTALRIWNAEESVTGPLTSTSDHIAVFNGTSGKLIKDGGVAISDMQADWLSTSGSSEVLNHPDIYAGDEPFSTVEGEETVAVNRAEHAQGQFNVSNTGSTNAENTINSIGIGADDTHRANAVEVMKNGDMYVYGIGGYQGTTTSGAKKLQDLVKVFTPPTEQEDPQNPGQFIEVDGTAGLVPAPLASQISSSDASSYVLLGDATWGALSTIVPASQTQPDWEVSSGIASILHKPAFNDMGALKAGNADTAEYKLPVLTYEESYTLQNELRGYISSSIPAGWNTSSGTHYEIPITPDVVGIVITGIVGDGNNRSSYTLLTEEQLPGGSSLLIPVPTFIPSGEVKRISISSNTAKYIYICGNNGTTSVAPTQVRLIKLIHDDGYVHIDGAETITGQKTFTSDVVLWNGGGTVDTPTLEFRRGTNDDKNVDWKILGSRDGLEICSSALTDIQRMSISINGTVDIPGYSGGNSLTVDTGNVDIHGGNLNVGGTITSSNNITSTSGSVLAGVDVSATGYVTTTGGFKGLMYDAASGHYIMSYANHSLIDSSHSSDYQAEDTMPVTAANVVHYVDNAVGNIPSPTTYHWANESVSETVSYSTSPEVKQVTINGTTGSTTPSSDHCVMTYDTTNKCLKFTF